MPTVAGRMGFAVANMGRAFDHMLGERMNTWSCWEDPHTAWGFVRNRGSPPAVIELS